MKTEILITQGLLKEVIDYDPSTGVFRWKIARHKVAAGSVAGQFLHHRGYVKIKIFGIAYIAHRLAWLYMTGEWPKDQIDHINMDRADNRFCNLREAGNGQNHMNQPHKNRTGFKGVAYHPWLKEKPFEAKIKTGGINRSLGCYATAEEAHEAYKKAAIAAHGEFARF